MCSIFGILDIEDASGALREVALRQSRLLRHRGPDWSGSYTHPRAVLAHERLAIVDVNTGAQPLISQDGSCALAVNGEIYNHAELRSRALVDYDFSTDSDCEVILPLYQAPLHLTFNRYTTISFISQPNMFHLLLAVIKASFFFSISDI